MNAFWKFTYWRLCGLRNALDAVIRFCRVRAGYATRGRSAEPITAADSAAKEST